jgi:RNA polymerase primary sigma factor
VKRAERELAQRLGRRPSCEEVAREAGADEAIVADLRRAELAPVSLSEPIADGEIPFEELLSDDGQADPAFAVADGENATGVHSAMSALPRRARRILELHYGLDGQRPRTFSEIAGEVGVSRGRVQQLEARTLRELAARPELQSLRQAA